VTAFWTALYNRVCCKVSYCQTTVTLSLWSRTVYCWSQIAFYGILPSLWWT